MIPAQECRRVADLLRALPGHPEERTRLVVAWCSARSLGWFREEVARRREALGRRLGELDRCGARGMEAQRRELAAQVRTLDAALAALEG